MAASGEKPTPAASGVPTLADLPSRCQSVLAELLCCTAVPPSAQRLQYFDSFYLIIIEGPIPA
jgi:hypothetical protein